MLVAVVEEEEEESKSSIIIIIIFGLFSRSRKLIVDFFVRNLRGDGEALEVVIQEFKSRSLLGIGVPAVYHKKINTIR